MARRSAVIAMLSLAAACEPAARVDPLDDPPIRRRARTTSASTAKSSATAAVSASTQAPKPAPYRPVSEFDPGRDAAKDLEAAVAEASRERKKVLLDVGGTWCVWCKRLDQFIAGDREIAALMAAHFVTMKVSVTPDNENGALLSRYPKIRGYPHLFVLDERGALLHSQGTGELEQGTSYDRTKFLTFVRRWADGEPAPR